MKTNENEPINPCMYTKIGEGDNDYAPLKDGQKTGWEIKFGGLTKREHMAIEFTKAILTAGNSLKPNTSNETICIAGITLADELIKQLNQAKTT